MKQFLKLAMLSTAAAAFATSGLYAQTVSRAYGIQVYSESMKTDDPQKLISFPVDNPQDITVEETFSDFSVMAATCHNDLYYMLQTDDGVVPTKLVTYDISRHTFSEVATFNFNYDLAASLMVVDMTYDPSSDLIYAVALNLAEGEFVDDNIDAPFGLFTIDPQSGYTELVAYQETAFIVALASNEYELWGVDSEGNVWIVNKYRGYLDDIMTSTGIAAVGLQSMAYDFGSGHFYWPSYTQRGEDGKSELLWFGVNDWWDIESGEVGPVGDNIELIGFYVDDDPINPKAPRVVENLVVAPADNGLGEAVLSWTNPVKALNGSDLNGDLTIIIKRNDEVIASELTGAPGEEMTWTDTNVKSALYTYTVTASIDGNEGAPVYAEPVFVGTDVPGAPTDVKAARKSDSFDITVSWSAPSAGAEGGWVDLTDVHYTVVRYPDNKVIVENTSELSLVDTDIVKQAGYYYGVKAVNGSEVGPEAVSNIVVSGPAIEPPYSMTLDQEDAGMWSVYNVDGDQNNWYVYRDLWGGTSDPFFYFFPEEDMDVDKETSDWIISPTFTLKAGKKYIVSYDLRLYGHMFLANTSLWMGESATPEGMTRELVSYDHELINVEWVTHTVPFTVDSDGDYNFGFELSNLVPAHFYKFNLREVADVELASTSLNGPQILTQNSVFDFKTNISNLGFNTIDNYTVCLKDSEGKILAEKLVETPIAAGETRTVTIEWTPEISGRVTLHAEVVVNGDADDTNNISPELTVMVSDGGSWANIAEANYSSGREPFFVYHNYSACQSIYPASLIGLKEGAELEAMNYFIADFLTTKPIDCDIEVWMANTDYLDFEFAPVFFEDEMTKVFDGTVTMSPTDEQVTMLFDTTFVYTGKNLLVATRHKSDNRASVAFDCYYDKYASFGTLEYYSDIEPFDFYQEMYGARELPSMSVLVRDETTGLSVASSDLSAVSYERGSRTLVVSGDFETCDVFSTTGSLIASFRPGTRMVLPEGLSGIGIVEVKTTTGTIVKKIIL